MSVCRTSLAKCSAHSLRPGVEGLKNSPRCPVILLSKAAPVMQNFAMSREGPACLITHRERLTLGCHMKQMTSMSSSLISLNSDLILRDGQGVSEVSFVAPRFGSPSETPFSIDASPVVFSIHCACLSGTASRFALCRKTFRQKHRQLSRGDCFVSSSSRGLPNRVSAPAGWASACIRIGCRWKPIA